MSDMEQRTIDRLMQVINRQNETIDKQFSTILHLEEQIREYQKIGECKRI